MFFMWPKMCFVSIFAGWWWVCHIIIVIALFLSLLLRCSVWPMIIYAYEIHIFFHGKIHWKFEDFWCSNSFVCISALFVAEMENFWKLELDVFSESNPWVW